MSTSWGPIGSMGDIGPIGPRPPLTIGIIGTGQLGGFLRKYPPPKNLLPNDHSELRIISYGPNLPLDPTVHFQNENNQLTRHFCGHNYPEDYCSQKYHSGDLSDTDAIIEFGKQCDIITYEIENIPIEALEILQNQYNKKVYPDPQILKTIQNKLTQKQFLIQNKFQTPPLTQLNTYPIVLKTETGGYDGRGVQIIRNGTELTQSKLTQQPHFFEQYIPIKYEISIIIGRNSNGEIFFYDPALTVPNEMHQLYYLVAPAKTACRLSEDQITLIQETAKRLAITLNLVGIMAIEFFISQKDNELYINEISPRPHNTGHHTIDCYQINQYELLQRCLLNISLTNSSHNTPIIRPFDTQNEVIILTNLIGDNFNSNLSHDDLKITPFFHPDFKVYSYGKTETYHGRKLGHITIRTKENLVGSMVHAGYTTSSPCFGLTSAKKMFGVNSTAYYFNIKEFPFRMKYAIHIIPPPPSKTPSVAVIMGSSSDLPTMEPAIQVLQDFRIPYEMQIVSAHRTPEFMQKYSEFAEQRGLQVIIAGAGGAAHLPGMVASNTTLPVIGVPVKSSNSYQGLDSLLSICQMPGGIPVATMAINGSKNAGLLAIRMLSLTSKYPHLKKLLNLYQLTLQEKVVDMNRELNGPQVT